MWGGGSDRNRNNDLVHNAQRVINKLKASGTNSWAKADLIRDLAPSGKNEAFCWLIQKMIEVRLLCEHEELLQIQHDALDCDMEDRLCALRAVYATGETGQGDAGLLDEFRELHPFNITFTVRWDNLDPKIAEWWTGIDRGQVGPTNSAPEQ